MVTETELPATNDTRPNKQEAGKRSRPSLFGFGLRIFLLCYVGYFWWSSEEPFSIGLRLFLIVFIMYEALMLSMLFPRR